MRALATVTDAVGLAVKVVKVAKVTHAGLEVLVVPAVLVVQAPWAASLACGDSSTTLGLRS